MFSLFSFLSFSIDYDLHQPFKNSAPGEFGLWSVAGSTSNMKNSIHLSSRKDKLNGALCSRVPTSIQKFDVEMNVSIISGTLHYLYTQDACPFSQRYSKGYWRGFSIDFEEIEGSTNLSFTMVRNDYSYNTQHLCTLDTQNPYIKIVVDDNQASIYNLENNEWKQCGSQHVFPVLVVGYFSFAAFPTEKFAISNVFSFNTSIPKDHIEEFNTERLEKLVKRIVNPKNKTERKMTVAERISYTIPDDEKYSNYMLYIDQILGEMNRSLTRSLGSNELQSLIDQIMKKKLSRIERKFEKRKEILVNIDDSLKNVKRTIQADLSTLESNIYTTMEATKRTAVDELKKFLEKAHAAEKLTAQTKLRANEVKQMWLPTFLYVFAFIELALYLAFFFQKKKATHNFKKYD